MNGGQHCPFPSTSAIFYRPATTLARSTPSPQSSVPSDVEVLATANTKTKKSRVKSADWTEEETHEVLEAWAPKFSKLWGVSQRQKIKLWNDIYSLYKERCPESQRMLQQVK